MTENDYSIKPLPNLPNVTGLNPPKGGEDQEKRQQQRKRSQETPHPAEVEEEAKELEENEFMATMRDDGDQQHIDYRA